MQREKKKWEGFVRICKVYGYLQIDLAVAAGDLNERVGISRMQVVTFMELQSESCFF